jgi:DNA-directed RNA polymerase subunit RPC12/RpoP
LLILYKGFNKAFVSLCCYNIYMIKQSKKHIILGGVKVSSKKLGEWGSSGGRPKKYNSNAERQRAYKLRKKQTKFGKEIQLEPRRTYGEIKIKKYLTCPQCGVLNNDLKKYFNEKGEYIPETYWMDTVRLVKTNIHENTYHCLNCSHGFSFIRGEIKPKEREIIVKRAGTGTERSQRSRAKRSSNHQSSKNPLPRH